jgi:hypothetical protein
VWIAVGAAFTTVWFAVAQISRKSRPDELTLAAVNICVTVFQCLAAPLDHYHKPTPPDAYVIAVISSTVIVLGLCASLIIRNIIYRRLNKPIV